MTTGTQNSILVSLPGTTVDVVPRTTKINMQLQKTRSRSQRRIIGTKSTPTVPSEVDFSSSVGSTGDGEEYGFEVDFNDIYPPLISLLTLGSIEP
jgi:hypothetical protein